MASAEEHATTAKLDTSSGPTRAFFTIQELRVRPGHEQEFVERFRALDVLALAGGVSDLVEAVLVRRDDHFEVVSVWASDSAIDAWVASSERVRVRDELEPLYSQPAVVNSFEVLSRYSTARSSG